MIRQRMIFACLSLAAFSLMTTCRDVAAGDYVWARSAWMAGPNRPVSAMGNGYGGYYVPRNQYGNNYEGQRFTNPTGFIVPGQQPQQSQQGFRLFRR